MKYRSNEQFMALISQPIDGLLYDLDLMPAQCRTVVNSVRSEVISELKKQIEQMKSCDSCKHRRSFKDEKKYCNSCTRWLYYESGCKGERDNWEMKE